MYLLKSGMMIGLMLFMTTVFSVAANINVTTKYGDTGGIIGVLNQTTDKVNGRIICPNNPTDGCDFSADAGFNNNNTVDDPSDDYYTGDLLVRTNDNFQAIAGWTWNGTPNVGEDVVTITGTLPASGYYEWTQLPGSCDVAQSSISADKQTIICVRSAFDPGNVGTKSEDLTFNVRVKGGTPDGATPGDISFKIEAVNAAPVTDTTDGNSLTVTAAPRWNLEKSAYTILAGQEYDLDNNGTLVKGWIMDYMFYIESDEVTRNGGEIDTANPIVGNESMGTDATFTFTDDLSGLPPHAKVVGCSMNGRYQYQDGYVGSANPATCIGAGCVGGYGDPLLNHILAPKGQQQISCVQTGNSVALTIEHVDASLNNYPTKDYLGNDLPVNRAIAAIGNLYVFIPVDDVKNGENNVSDGCQVGTAGCDDGVYVTKNKATGFDPTTPTGNSNFGAEVESEKDNNYNATLYYATGSFSKYFRGGFATKPTQNTTAGYIASTYRSGDGLVTTGAEFSTWLTSNNRGGTPFTEASACDVIDAYRYKVQAVQDNGEYTTIKTVYTGKPEWPYRMYIGGDDGNFTDASGADNLPFIVEYATGYVDNSFLASQGGDTTVTHTSEVITECTDASVVWTTDFDSVKNANGGLGVTKIRYRLKPGYEYPIGGYMYMLINHEARTTDLATGQPLQNNDLLVNYAANKYNYYTSWAGPDYKPGTYPGNHTGYRGDRYMITGPKVRIKKLENRQTASPGSEVVYTLQTSYTDDIGSAGNSGQVTVTDVLPKDFNYITGSVTPASFGEPTIGTCADVVDITTAATPCVNGENQVLIWDYGIRPVNAPGIPDLNYTVQVGASANVGVNTNVAKIESPTDASPVSQRKSEIGLTIDVPSSINIVKSTEENPAYPSKRERTTTPKDIFFLMDMRNGKNGEIFDLDVIDILPFIGDGNTGAIKFNNLNLQRNVNTDYHGSMKFHEASFSQHPGSTTACDMTANGGVKYYYTNIDPTTINMAPTVGNENDLTNAASVWCEGDANGPNGCTITSSNFTFTNNSEVTAVRARGPRMEKQAICQFRVHVSVVNNLMADNYSNSAGASATGITLPVLSNSKAVPIVGSSLGNSVWYDADKDGIQDIGESNISGVMVHLLDNAGNPVNDPTTGQPYVVTTDVNGTYLFTNLNHGNYKVKFDVPTGYAISPKSNSGDDATDSDVNSGTNETDVIALGVDEYNPNVDLGLNTPVISGHIFDDGDGDGNVTTTTPINTPDGVQLYATLLDENGNVLATTPIAADGTYSFDGADGVRANSKYKVVLSTAQNATTSTLPSNWNNSGQQPSNTGANGNDGNVSDGMILEINVGTTDVPDNDFGINKKPEAVNKNKPSEMNPGGSTQVSVPTLEKHDLEDGNETATKIKITELPTNATLYYNGLLVTAGQIIDNYDPSKLTLDPNDGELTAIFKYTVFDKDGQESDPATVTMPFTGVTLSGHVFDDGSGDANINGTPINKPDGTQLYATLLDSNGDVMASIPVDDNGTYAFTGADGVTANTEYSIVLGTTQGTVGNPAPAASLPANWNNADGEQPNNNGTGNDGQTNGAGNGKMTLTTGNTATNPNNDFGINHKPVANDTNETSQLNPGGTTQVQVPDLNVTDTEDGKPTTITIKDLPTNATLYYDGTAVTAGQVIPNFDPTKLTVDPIDGDQTVVFNYTTTDAAGVESDPATVTMPFTGLGISGNIFNDGDGDADVTGTAIPKPDATQLYATLLDTNGAVLATTPIAADGTYSFDGTDGVTANTNYTIVLATSANATTPNLPTNWNNTGENINSAGAGNDGSPDGTIAVSLGTVVVPQVDFGINKKPVANDVSKPIQNNPGGNVQVPVPHLDISDNEDGTPTTVTIKTLPTNGTLYYNGTPVTAGQVIPNFDPSKLTVDPNNGNVVIMFNYTTTDAAGIESDPAKVTMPFNGDGIIKGNVSAQDTNGNLKPIANVTLILFDTNGNEVARTKTDAQGNYTFNVPPGNYYIQEAQPNGYYNVSENEGGADNESTNNLLNTINVTVGVGETDVLNDFIESTTKVGCNCAPTPVIPCAICTQGFYSTHTHNLKDNSTEIHWVDSYYEIAYDIYLNGKFIATVGEDQTRYTLTGLQSGTEYTAVIIANNGYGGKTRQTITFTTTDSMGWLPAIYHVLSN